MAVNEKLETITRPASTDLSTKQYLFTKLDSAGKAAVCSVAGEPAVGVQQNKPAALDRETEIGFHGVSKVIAGGTVASMAKVTTDAAGKAVTAASTNNVAGLCIDGGVVGDIITVLLGVAPPVLA